jgi:hypothetical protein
MVVTDRGASTQLPMPAAGKLLARASRRAQSRCGRENGSWGLPPVPRGCAGSSMKFGHASRRGFEFEHVALGFCLQKRCRRSRSTSAPTFSFVQFPQNARAFPATKLPSYCYRRATICAISIAPPIRSQNRHDIRIGYRSTSIRSADGSSWVDHFTKIIGLVKQIDCGVVRLRRRRLRMHTALRRLQATD